MSPALDADAEPSRDRAVLVWAALAQNIMLCYVGAVSNGVSTVGLGVHPDHLATVTWHTIPDPARTFAVKT